LGNSWVGGSVLIGAAITGLWAGMPSAPADRGNRVAIMGASELRNNRDRNMDFPFQRGLK
jgi:hypothetical protein